MHCVVKDDVVRKVWFDERDARSESPKHNTVVTSASSRCSNMPHAVKQFLCEWKLN